MDNVVGIGKDFQPEKHRTRKSTLPRHNQATILPGPNKDLDAAEILGEFCEARKPGFVRNFFPPAKETDKLHIPLGLDNDNISAFPKLSESPATLEAKEDDVVKLPTFRNRSLKVRTRAEGGQLK